MTAIYDRTGREIHVGDVVKVFHFVGARRKRHYMYKQAVAIDELGESKSKWMRFSHLDMTGEGYHEPLNGAFLDDYEIVQGVNADHDARPRIDKEERS